MFFKIVDSKKGNYGWIYSIGIHDLKSNDETFDPTPRCGTGGLFYAKPEDILDFLGYGDTLCEVISRGQIVAFENKFKTDILEIILMYPLCEISTWEFMIKNGCPRNEIVCYWASENNNLELLKWARENECPRDEMVCYWAVRNNNLEMLKWARENGYPWDKWVCYWVARNNNLEILKWARENGCSWNKGFVFRPRGEII